MSVQADYFHCANSFGQSFTYEVLNYSVVQNSSLEILITKCTILSVIENPSSLYVIRIPLVGSFITLSCAISGGRDVIYC